MQNFKFSDRPIIKSNSEVGSFTSVALIVFAILAALIIINALLSSSDEQTPIWTSDSSNSTAAVPVTAKAKPTVASNSEISQPAVEVPQSLESKKAVALIKAQDSYMNNYMLNKYHDDDWDKKAHYGGGLMELSGDSSEGYFVSGFGNPVIGRDSEVSQTILDTDGEAWVGYWGTGEQSKYVAIFTTKTKQTYYISNTNRNPILYNPDSADHSVEFAVAKKLSESLLL